MSDVEGFPLSPVEGSLNVNEKRLVEPLLDKVLGDGLEVELLAADSSQASCSACLSHVSSCMLYFGGV